MRLTTPLLSFGCLIATVSAVLQDDAYQTDYHHELLGQPQSHTTFFQKPFSESKASLVYTLSDQLIVGATNPRDGSLVWRQPLALDSKTLPEGFLRAGRDQDTVVSGVGNKVAAWGASDGRLVWEKKFEDCLVQDLEVLEQARASESDPKDIIVLFNGVTPALRRLDGNTGDVKWTFEDSSGDVPFQVSSSDARIFLIALHSSLLGGFKTKVSSIDPHTGKKTDQYALSSDSEITSADDILFVGANSASPLIVWTDKAHKVLKVNVIGNKNVASLNIEGSDIEDIEEVIVHAPHTINSKPHFLAHYRTATSHWADVYHVDLTSAAVKKAYRVEKLDGKGAFAVSSSHANVFFTRISLGQSAVFSSDSSEPVASWAVEELSAREPLRVESEVVPSTRSGKSYSVRSAVLLSNDDWVLVQNEKLVWTRPEGLAGSIKAVFLDLPEEATLAEELRHEVHQNFLAAYIHRVKRHLKDLEKLPSWLQSLPKRIIGSFLGFDDENTGTSPDTFGLNKVLAVATAKGRIFGLATGASGKVLWNIQAETPGGTDWETCQLTPFSKGILLVQFKDPNHNLYLDATNGKSIPAEKVAVSKPVTSSAASSDGATTIKYEIVDGNLEGFIDGKKESGAVWQFSPSKGEQIAKVTSKEDEGPAAAIGKVLGDRSVLYKHLDPNVALVTTTFDSSELMRVYLLDTVSGNIIHTSEHVNVDTSRPVSTIFCDNWYAYSYTLSASASPSRGYVLVSGELYESALPDDRGPLGASSNYSSFAPSSVPTAQTPHVVVASFHIAEEISHLSVTRTRQGITSRQLLAMLPESYSLVGIPRAAIDPRRPVGRDPNSIEAAEGLVRYGPALEIDPKWVLNHKREILGVKEVLATPALIESTSIVVAVGLDVFGTRVAPSFSFDVLGKNFNKLQMCATVLALAVGVFVVAPLVKRKQINAQWQVT